MAAGEPPRWPRSRCGCCRPTGVAASVRPCWSSWSGARRRRGARPTSPPPTRRSTRRAPGRGSPPRTATRSRAPRSPSCSTSPPPPERWPPLEDDVAAHLDGYRVVAFEDHVPEGWVDDFCGLLSVFMTLVPSGDLDLEDVAVDARPPARARGAHRRVRAGLAGRGRGGAGRAARRLHRARGSPARTRGSRSVGGTLVLPEHRGHRLGLGMKAREPPPAARAVPRVPGRRHHQRRGERPDERRQRGARLPRRRALPRRAEAGHGTS